MNRCKEFLLPIFVRPSIACLLLLIVIVSGCSSGGRPFVSDMRLQALEHNRRGVEAEARGLNERALQEFKTAMQLSSAIDDADGTVVALLNLSRMARRSGDLIEAEGNMQRAAIRGKDVPSRNGDIAVEMTLLLLAQGRTEAAKGWSLRAVELCVAENRAACFNLQARVLWNLADATGAESSARQALLTKGGVENRVEAANAHRLLGEIAMASGRNEEAASAFAEALALDKEAGLSSRIASDMRFLAQLATRAGSDQDAMRYLYRAFEVSLNGGDTSGAANDLAFLAAISRKAGDTARADALENQRLELLGTITDKVSPSQH